MSGVTDPSQEYFKDGLWAWVTDQWKKLIGDDAGHLQIDIVESGLPAGAATSANQTTMITALQLIDDLRAALNSVATDELDVVIDGQTVDVEIKQTTAADLTPGVMGWDGSAWRKLPLMWGYSDVYGESPSAASTGGASTIVYSSIVPAGEVWVIHNVVLRHDDPVARSTLFYAVVGGTPVFVQHGAALGQWVVMEVQTTIVLKEDDYLYCEVTALANTKNVYLAVCGYKMKVAE